MMSGRHVRSTKATKKVWVVLFTCLSSRGIHIELLSSLDSSTFQLASRRFTALLGDCKHFRRDRRSNFLPTRNDHITTSGHNKVTEYIKKTVRTWQLTTQGANQQECGSERLVPSKTVCRYSSESHSPQLVQGRI